MGILKSHYKFCFTDRYFLFSVVTGLLLLLGSLFVNFYAGVYATNIASNAVTDVVLSNIPAFDLDGIFSYGSIVFWIFIGFLCILRPQRMPFIFKSIALFVLVRSLFISITHIGPYPIHTELTAIRAIRYFTFPGDLFFSAHTGLPFLMALIFWENKKLRYLFIFLSLFFGAVVLLAHLHYSVDVLSAFFITPTIFHLSKFFFKKDAKMFSTVVQDKALPQRVSDKEKTLWNGLGNIAEQDKTII